MTFKTIKSIPGSDRIIDETIELFCLANTMFVSKEVQGHLSTHRYLVKEFDEYAKRLIIEKLLSIAIKLRFLDDKAKLIYTHDRSNAGVLILDDKEEKVGLRVALNKIIHHESISVFAQKSKITVTDMKTTFPVEELVIAEGSYPGFSIFVRAEGKNGNQSWTFHSELTSLTNEILRVFYFENHRDQDTDD